MAVRSKAPTIHSYLNLAIESACMRATAQENAKAVESRLLLCRRIDASNCGSKRFVRQDMAVSHISIAETIQ